jgi:hypothetical protein
LVVGLAIVGVVVGLGYLIRRHMDNRIAKVGGKYDIGDEEDQVAESNRSRRSPSNSLKKPEVHRLVVCSHCSC